MLELFEIYSDWFGGDRDSATDKLVNSQFYKNSDLDFLLASARISADEKDWHSSKMMYDRIQNSAQPFVLYESAEVHLQGHDPMYALELYDILGQTSLKSLKGRISAYTQLGSDKDVLNAIHDYLENEYVGTREYAECINMLLDSNKISDAQNLLDRMGRSNKKDPEYLMCYSKFRLNSGDFRGAKHSIAEAVRTSNGDISAVVLSARIKLLSGDIRGSEKDCKKAMKIEPSNLDALAVKRDILMKKGDHSEALEICRQILSKQSADITTMMIMAEAMRATGDDNGSNMTLRRILDIDQSRDNILKVVRFMIESGMYRDAMYLCYEMENTLPGDAMLRRLRGNAEYNLGEYVKASISYASAAEVDPHDPVIWHSKGMADEARGDLQSAESCYDRAVLLDLNVSEYWMSKASIQEKFGDLYGAIESLNRAIQLDPDSIYPMVRKAIILENEERYKEALYFAEMCLVTNPYDTNVKLLAARLLRECGRYNEAITMASQAHSASDTEDSAIELANCYTASGRRSEAIRVIERRMVKNDSPRLQEILTSIEQGRDEIALQLPATERSKIDMAPEEAAQLAASMASIGDYKGALRTIDIALAGSGDDLKYLVIKIGYLLDMGDIKAATDLTTEAIKANPKVAVLHESMGDVKMAKSEYRGALQEYEKAMSMGLNMPELLVKKGDAQQKLGFSDRSIDSYTMAVNRMPENREIRAKLIEKLIDKGYLSRAESQLVTLLKDGPEDAQSIIMLAKVRKDLRKDMGVTETYKMFRACSDPGEAATERMIAVLEGAGHDEEAKSLRKQNKEPVEDTKAKRMVEMALRRSFTSKISPTDQDFLESMGLDEDQITEVIRYINKEFQFGEIIPGSPLFQDLERMSNKVIMAIGNKDFDNGYDLPLEQVFWHSGYKDVDDAKRLKAYIKKALTCDVQRDDTLKIVLDRVQGLSTYDIMKACKVGVYQARQVQLLLGVRS